MSRLSAPERRERLLDLYRELGPDHQCPLVATRTNVVFGSGNADADLMFVGEAPGATEDREGRPFVGHAGRLLDKLLDEIGLARGDAFIANVLKCRPPANRDPRPDEIEECSPYLIRQIELIEPKVVCTLGNFSTKLLSGSPAGITKVHGRPQVCRLGTWTARLYPIFHPAAALRTQALMDLLREDFTRLPALLAEPAPDQHEDAGGTEAGPTRVTEQHEPDATSPSGRGGEPPQLDLFG